MLRIAVTGGIACGKSLVGSLMKREGIAVCEADELAHGLLEPGETVRDAVIAAFGKDCLGEEGQIDRRRLGARVFGNPALLEKLNALMHPEVRKRWQRWIAQMDDKVMAVAVIIPLLYEAGLDDEWDRVVCVSASESCQLKRLEERGLRNEEARERLAAQMAQSEKMRCADFVIVNNGSEEELKEQTKRVLDRILEN